MSPNRSKKRRSYGKGKRKQLHALTAVALVAIVAMWLITRMQPNTNNLNIDPRGTESQARIPQPRAYLNPQDKAVHEQLVTFASWLHENGAKGIIGEFGWPGYDPDWDAIGQNWLSDISQTDIEPYYWATGEHWLEDYALNPYFGLEETNFIPSSQAEILESHAQNYPLGINIAGLEFGFDNPGSGKQGTDYFSHTENVFKSMALRGYSAVRIPFRWERMQPTPAGSLDPAYSELVRGTVEMAQTQKLDVVLDLHNYGAYKTPQGTLLLGDGDFDHTMLSDIWAKLHDGLRHLNGSKISYGLMNEPHDLPGGAAAWEATSQNVVQTLRSKGVDNTLIVAGYDWSRAKGWTERHTKAWIQDPNNNVRYEAHHYWDDDASGFYD